MPDTRPYEAIQHSSLVGIAILEHYGAEAWAHWLKQCYRMYHGERRHNPAHKRFIETYEHDT